MLAVRKLHVFVMSSIIVLSVSLNVYCGYFVTCACKCDVRWKAALSALVCLATLLLVDVNFITVPVNETEIYRGGNL